MRHYIEGVRKEIRAKRDAKDVEAELYDHYEEKKALYAQRGFPEDQAGAMAEDAFGEDPAGVGTLLASLHRRSRILDAVLSLLCLAVLAAAGALILFGFLFDYGSGLRRHTPVYTGFPYWAFVPVPAALLAYRRRLILPSAAAAFLLCFSAGVTLPAAFVWAELFSGGLPRMAAANSVFRLAAASPALQAAHFAFTLLTALGAAALGVLSLRKKLCRSRKGEGKVGRGIAILLAAALLVQAGAFGLFRLFGKRADPADFGIPEYPAADRVVVILDDDAATVARYRDGTSDWLAVKTEFHSVFADPVPEVDGASMPYTYYTPEETTEGDGATEELYGVYHMMPYARLDGLLDRVEPDGLSLRTERRRHVLVLGLDERSVEHGEWSVDTTETVWQRELEWKEGEPLTVRFDLYGCVASELVLYPE